jgi:hypothetical protein
MSIDAKKSRMPGMVVHICNPSDEGGGGKRIKVQGLPRRKKAGHPT